MYGFQDHIEITFEQLLQKITPQEIFEFVMGEPFNFEARYVSPFREDDTKPGCRFEQREDGTILFVDFGERHIRPERTHRNCMRMVMEKFNVSLTGAITVLCNHFGLSKNPQDYSDVIVHRPMSQESKCLITYDPRPFLKPDIIHWSQFIIKPEHLQEDNVFATRKFIIKKGKSRKVIITYKFCYAIDFIDSVKIYQPYSENYRWITNCDEDHIGNIDNLPATGNELIVQKSYKDHRVLRNLDPKSNVIWFQNEGCIPSIDILKDLVNRFKLITVFFDNDPDGIKAAIKVSTVFNSLRENCCRMIYLPETTKDKKDPAGFIQKEGRLDTIQVLKQIGLYGKDT